MAPNLEIRGTNTHTHRENMCAGKQYIYMLDLHQYDIYAKRIQEKASFNN